MFAKTVYAKEFPLNATLNELQEFFEQYGEVENIFMRKNERREFKGSVFVTYSNEGDARNFLDATCVKYEGKAVEVRKTKSQYYQEKGEEKKKKQQQEADKKLLPSYKFFRDQAQKYKSDVVHGTILRVDGFELGTSREDIRDLMKDFAPIQWIDYNKGEMEAFIRYDEENQAIEALEKANEAMNNEVTLNGSTLNLRVLEGEEEEVQWKKMYEAACQRLEKKRSSKNFQKGRWGRRPGKATRLLLKRQKEQEEEERRKFLEGDGQTSEEVPQKKAKMEGDV